MAGLLHACSALGCLCNQSTCQHCATESVVRKSYLDGLCYCCYSSLLKYYTYVVLLRVYLVLMISCSKLTGGGGETLDAPFIYLQTAGVVEGQL